MKYGGIHYDYGQLTRSFLFIFVFLQNADQQKLTFFSATWNKNGLQACSSGKIKKENFKALVCKLTGNNPVNNRNTVSLKKSEHSGLKGHRNTDVKNCDFKSEQFSTDLPISEKISKYSKKLKFGTGLVFNPNPLPQKADHSFSVFVNNDAGTRYTNPTLPVKTRMDSVVGGCLGATGLQVSGMNEFTYSYYKNYLTTKRIAPNGFTISHEKLAIRACDLLRFLTISFLRTKSEKDNSLTSTICSNCFLAVACNCVSLKNEVGISINLKEERRTTTGSYE